MRTRTREIETCCVVDQFCDSPANLEVRVPVKGRCVRCGEAVCRKCSTRRRYGRAPRARLCNNCQVEIDGNELRVLARLHRMARGDHDRT